MPEIPSPFEQKSSSVPERSEDTIPRIRELVAEHQGHIYAQTSRLFSILMLFQWMAGIVAAVWISPRAWAGARSSIHIHVWLAILLGGAITSLPVFLALVRPRDAFTRYTVAVCQMLMSSLLKSKPTSTCSARSRFWRSTGIGAFSFQRP